ncbi:MFS transporter [Thalassobaculum sp.]|uniref:MFS transporter n=1 Tax=Thalassobaculum sp. TaxID=2022740 RepID=UPI0032EA9A01
MPPATGSSAILRTLRHPDYGLYTLGNSVSLIGMWMQRISIGWLTWDLTHSGTWLGAVAFADLFPSVFIGLIGGVAADRLDRVRVIMACQGTAMLLSVLMGILTLSGHVTVELLFVLVFLGGVVIGFNQPSRLALVPSLVPRENLTTAVAINSIVFNTARFIGPAIAGLVIVASDVAWAFFANAVSYLALLVALAVIRRRNPGAGRDPGAVRPRTGIIADIGAGIGYAVRHPGIGPLLGLHLVGSIMVRPVLELLPGFADRVFQGGADTLATLTSTVGIGAVIGGWLLARRSGTDGLVTLVLASTAGISLAVLAFVATDELWVGIAAAAVLGAVMVASGVGLQTVVQLAVEPSIRGRVLALHGLIFRGGPAIGALMMGTAGDLVGLPIPVGVGAVVALVMTGLVALRSDRIRAAIEGPPPAVAGRSAGDGGGT